MESSGNLPFGFAKGTLQWARLIENAHARQAMLPGKWMRPYVPAHGTKAAGGRRYTRWFTSTEPQRSRRYSATSLL